MDKYFLDQYSLVHYKPSSSGKKRVNKKGKIIKAEGVPINHILQEYFLRELIPNYSYNLFLEEYKAFADTKYVSDTDQNHLGIRIGNHLNIKEDRRLIFKAYKVILVLHYRFSIPYHIFIPIEKRDFLLGDYHANLASKTYYTDLRDANFGSSEFVEKYQLLIKYCLNDCSESIKIYEYTGRGSKDIGSLSLVPYFQANYAIYSLYLKHMMENRSCEYHRIFGLPIYFQFDDRLERTSNTALYLFAKQCSSYSFQHVCDVLFNLNSTIRNNSEFSISFMPPRTYQYALFDKKRIYNEYYKMSEKGTSTPTFSFINDTQGSLSGFSDSLNMEFDGLIDQHQNTFPITERIFLSAFIKVSKDLSDLIDHKKAYFLNSNTNKLKKGLLEIKDSLGIYQEWISKKHLNGMIELHNIKLNILHDVFNDLNKQKSDELKTISVEKTNLISKILAIPILKKD